MPDITLTFTAEEVLLLADWLEQANARRSQERDARGEPLPPLTAPQFLVEHLRGDLANRRRELQDSTRELATLLRPLSPEARAAVVAQLPAGGRKAWLQARLAQPEEE